MGGIKPLGVEQDVVKVSALVLEKASVEDDHTAGKDPNERRSKRGQSGHVVNKNCRVKVRSFQPTEITSKSIRSELNVRDSYTGN